MGRRVCKGCMVGAGPGRREGLAWAAAGTRRSAVEGAWRGGAARAALAPRARDLPGHHAPPPPRPPHSCAPCPCSSMHTLTTLPPVPTQPTPPRPPARPGPPRRRTILSPVSTHSRMLASASARMHAGTPSCSLSSMAVQPSSTRSRSMSSDTWAQWSGGRFMLARAHASEPKSVAPLAPGAAAVHGQAASSRRVPVNTPPLPTHLTYTPLSPPHRPLAPHPRGLTWSTRAWRSSSAVLASMYRSCHLSQGRRERREGVGGGGWMADGSRRGAAGCGAVPHRREEEWWTPPRPALPWALHRHAVAGANPSCESLPCGQHPFLAILPQGGRLTARPTPATKLIYMHAARRPLTGRRRPGPAPCRRGTACAAPRCRSPPCAAASRRAAPRWSGCRGTGARR